MPCRGRSRRYLAGCDTVNLPHFDNAAIEEATPYPELIAAIGAAFRHGGVAPARHVHGVPKTGENDSVLLIMPSWNDTGQFGVKLATINAENASRDLPTINGIYVLFDGLTAMPVATFDASARASKISRRPDFVFANLP